MSERTAMQFRLPDELAERLRAEAEKRDVSANLLATKAIERYLDALLPVENVL